MARWLVREANSIWWPCLGRSLDQMTPRDPSQVQPACDLLTQGEDSLVQCSYHYLSSLRLISWLRGQPARPGHSCLMHLLSLQKNREVVSVLPFGQVPIWDLSRRGLFDRSPKHVRSQCGQLNIDTQLSTYLLCLIYQGTIAYWHHLFPRMCLENAWVFFYFILFHFILFFLFIYFEKNLGNPFLLL